MNDSFARPEQPVGPSSSYIDETKAAVGDRVYYMRYGTPGGEHLPEPSIALVTAVLNAETNQCQLFVMNPNGTYHNSTNFSEQPKPGHWSWPKRGLR